MIKFYLNTLILALLFYSVTAQAATQETSDPYDQCVEQTLQKWKLANINNAVVESCSNKTKAKYEKQIVQLLDQIRQQDESRKNSGRYQDIMKSQKLWKQYVDQECQNAGSYIGSPMYEFCPMQHYQERVHQLTEYAQ